MTDTRRDLRAPIALKIRYKSASVDEFAEQYAADISRGGVFIKTKTPLDVGTLLKFELQLADETGIVAGVGRVVWIRKLEDAYEDHPAGMGIKFVKMDGQSRSFVEELVEKRGEKGGRFEAGSADVTPEKGLSLSGDGAPDPEDRSDLRKTSELLASAIAEAGVGGETASEALAEGEKAYRKSQETLGDARAATEGAASPASPAPAKPSKAVPIAAAAGVLALLGGGAYFVFGGEPAPATHAAALEAEPAPVEAAPAVHEPDPEPELAAADEAAEEVVPEPEPEPVPPYRLTIVTEPAGAKVTVGDQEVISPAEIGYDERPKGMDVAVVLAGYRSHYQRIRPSAYVEGPDGNFTAKLEITLKPRAGGEAAEGDVAPARPAAAAPSEAAEAGEATAKPEPKAEPEAPKAPEPKPAAPAGDD